MLKKAPVFATSEKGAKVLGYINKYDKVSVFSQMSIPEGRYAEIAWKGTRGFVAQDAVLLHITPFDELIIAVA